MYNGYFKMQDMTPTICKSIDTDGEKGMQLIDVRDDKVYWVAKLKDGNCWMTQNLDLDLSHEVALTSETSDIDPESYGKTIYTTETGYSKDKDTGVVSWLPSTIDSEGIQRADTINMVWNSATAATVPGWTNDNNRPYSADAGDRYRLTNPSTYNEINYTSLEDCTTADNSGAICQHGHYGNYYNWPAAVTSNDVSLAQNNSTWANSICPKNWSLPADGVYSTMLRIQNVYDSSNNYTKEGNVNVGFQRLITSPLYFARFGRISDNSLSNLGGSGFYWTNRARLMNTDSIFLVFNSDNIWPSHFYLNRYNGFSVRCMSNVN